MESDGPTRSLCDLPAELLLQITEHHLSFKDHLHWLLANRHHRECLSPILYLRPLPPNVDPSYEVWVDDQLLVLNRVTRKDVVQWALEYGYVGTLENVDEVQDIASFFGTTFRTTTIDGKLELLPMHIAALNGHTAIITYLVQKGADVNATTQNGLLPMHLAMTGEVVRLLASKGCRLDNDLSGMPSLTRSILHDCDASAVEAFLELGVDPSHPSEDGFTAAEAAIVRGSVDALRVLLDAGVDVNQPLAAGGYLLYKAIWLGARDHNADVAKHMATMLLDHGASPNVGLDGEMDPPYNEKPCHTPALFLAVMMQIPGSVDLVRLLLERGADQHMPYSRYRRQFYKIESALRGWDETLDESLVGNLLLAMLRSAPLDPDPEGPRKLELLVQYGGNINTHIGLGSLLQHTLLQRGTAIQRANDLIQPLIRLGADVHSLNEGDAPLHLLCDHFFATVQKYWLPTKTIRVAPFLASHIDAFIKAGADPNARDRHGRTPLMLLAHQPENVLTALLIRSMLRNPTVDVHAVDKSGQTVLHHVINQPPDLLTKLPRSDPFHHEPVCRLQLLLRSGTASDVNVYSEAGQTPLHLLLEARDVSRSSGGVGMAETKARALAMLIRAGADVRARTRESKGGFDGEREGLSQPESVDEAAMRPGAGETPLHLAVRGGYGKERLLTTEMLLRHGAGADVNYFSPGMGMTPLMVVVRAGAREELTRNEVQLLGSMLSKAGADTKLRGSKGRSAWDMFVDVKAETPVLKRPRAFLPGVSPWRLCLEDLGLACGTTNERMPRVYQGFQEI